MRTDSAIERYDRMMLRDLGSAPTYSWKWSEDLLHVMDAVNSGDGAPIRETINTGILDANGHEITLQGKQAKLTRRWPGLWQQWVVCALIELNSEDGRVHGTGIAAWIPVYDKRSRPAAIPEGIHPNQEHTEAFIKQVRSFRVKEAERMGQWEDFHKPQTVPMDESERNTMLISRSEKVKFEEAKLRFKDKFTAFGEEPGKKGSTSFPKTAKEMADDFNEYRSGLGMPLLVTPEHAANVQEISDALSRESNRSEGPLFSSS